MGGSLKQFQYLMIAKYLVQHSDWQSIELRMAFLASSGVQNHTVRCDQVVTPEEPQIIQVQPGSNTRKTTKDHSKFIVKSESGLHVYGFAGSSSALKYKEFRATHDAYCPTESPPQVQTHISRPEYPSRSHKSCLEV